MRSAYVSLNARVDWRLSYAFSFLEQAVEGSMHVKPIVHEIRIQNQVIFLDPPVEYARESWLKQLHEWLGE